MEKLTASHAGITVAAHGAFQTGHTNTTKKIEAMKLEEKEFEQKIQD